MQDAARSPLSTCAKMAENKRGAANHRLRRGTGADGVSCSVGNHG